MAPLLDIITNKNYLSLHMKLKRQNSGTLPRTFLVSLSLSVLLSTMPCCLSSSASANTQNLDRLETHFFEHTYAKDTNEARLERLEKLVFGEARQGDDDTRLSRLMTAVPDLSSAPAKSSARYSTSGNTDFEGSASSSADSQGSASTNEESQSGSSAAANSTDTGGQANAEGTSMDYPKVDALEQVLLGKTYKGKALSERLDQLEIKAFKRRSSSDLSERVSMLSDYLQRRYHRSVDQLVNPGGAPSGDDDAAPGAAPSYTGYQGAPSGSYGMGGGSGQGYPQSGASEVQQVAWLEQHVFGRTFPNNTLVDRIKRLDQTVFPSEPPDKSSSITMKLRVLINAVELMHTSGRNADTSGTAGPSTAEGSSQAGTGGYGVGSSNYGSAASGYGTSGSYGSGSYGSAASGYGTTNAYGSPSSSSSSGSYSGGTGSTSSFPNWPPQSSSQYSGSYSGQSSTSYDSGNNQYSPSQSGSTSENDYAQKHGHPLLGGLAKSLLTVGSMAARSMMYSGYGRYGGYGGYGGYGYGGYPSYGGYGGYGSGFGYGGIPYTLLRRGLYW